VRKNLAAYNLTNGQLLPWNPIVDMGSYTGFDNSVVKCMELLNNTLYFGGIFLEVGSSQRAGLAAIDLTTGNVTSWNPIVGSGKTPDQYINTLDISGNSVYVGGSFTNIASGVRSNAAELHLTTGSLQAWAPPIDDEVSKILIGPNNTAYAVLSSLMFGGMSINSNVVGINLNTGSATSWDPNLGYSVSDIALSATDIYVGGYFSFPATKDQYLVGLASYSLTTGALNDWTPDIGDNGEGGGAVASLATSPTQLHVGGFYNHVGYEDRSGYAAYDICSTIKALVFNGTTLSSPLTGEHYQWYQNGVALEGATTQSLEISLIEYGTYAVEVTNNSCIVRSPDFTYLVTESTKNEHITAMYPNPVRDVLHLNMPASASAILQDMRGSNISLPALRPGVNHIDTRSWHAGLYILCIQQGAKKDYYKIIKTH
jgi:hypothetical protein